MLQRASSRWLYQILVDFSGPTVEGQIVYLLNMK